MEFLDRKREIAELRRVLSLPGASKLIVIYGRRRLGKSTLIKKIITQEDIYYMAGDFVPAVQMNMLRDQIKERFPDIDVGQTTSWHDLFRFLNILTKEPFTLCLDEFPYLVKHSPELPSVIQRLVDSGELKYNIIICGSSQRMMQNMVLSSTEPLYGRASAILNIKPIPVYYLKEGLKLSPTSTIEEYAVWGGVPRYWELREGYSDLTEAIKGTLLSPIGILNNEPKHIFMDDTSSAVQIESIMTIIGSGVRRMSEIASRLGKVATALSLPLEKLINMNYLKREIPFGENIKKSKRGLYKINDPMMDFYYSFVMPNKSNIERGREDSVYSLIQSRFKDYVAHHWENLCREAVSGNEIFGHTWKEASRWWGSVKKDKEIIQLELDVVTESTDGKAIMIGECKWTNPEIASQLIKELHYKISHLPFAQDKTVVPVLFLKSEPKDMDNTTDIKILYPHDIINISKG